MNSNSLVFSHQLDTATALSRFFQSVYVFTAELPLLSLPEKIKVFHIPWKSGSPIKNSLTILRTLYPFIAKNRDAIVFSHMTDVHAALVSPLTWTLKMRHVIWYAHAVTSNYLFLSSFFVSAIVSSTPGSCNLRVNRDKIKFINQGIDQEDFPFIQRNLADLKKMLYYGRLDKSKNIDLFCELLRLLDSQSNAFTLDVFGKSSNIGSERFMRKVIEDSCVKLPPSTINFYGQIERRKIPLIAQNYDIFLNLFSGSLDKTLIEATLMGLPVVTWNQEYCSQFGTWSLLPAQTSLNFIAEEIESLKSRSATELQSELDHRKKEALEKHSFDGWIKSLNLVLRGE